MSIFVKGQSKMTIGKYVVCYKHLGGSKEHAIKWRTLRETSWVAWDDVVQFTCGLWLCKRDNDKHDKTTSICLISSNRKHTLTILYL